MLRARTDATNAQMLLKDSDSLVSFNHGPKEALGTRTVSSLGEVYLLVQSIVYPGLKSTAVSSSCLGVDPYRVAQVTADLVRPRCDLSVLFVAKASCSSFLGRSSNRRSGEQRPTLISRSSPPVVFCASVLARSEVLCVQNLWSATRRVEWRVWTASEKQLRFFGSKPWRTTLPPC